MVYVFPDIDRSRVYDIHSHYASRTHGNFISEAFAKRLLSNPRINLGPLKYTLPFDNRIFNSLTTYFYALGHKSAYERSRIVGHAVALAMAPCCNEEGHQTYSEFIIKNTVVLLLRQNDLAKNGLSGIYSHVGVSINPCSQLWRRDLTLAKNFGASLVKLLPNTQYIDLNEKRHTDYFKALVSFDLPLLVHTGDEHTVPGSKNELGTLSRLERALDQGVTVIAAHGTAKGAVGQNTLHQEQIDELLTNLETVKAHPHLYIDLAATTGAIRGLYLPHILRTAFKNKWMEKVLFGTDYPVGVSLDKFFFPVTLKNDIEELKNNPDKHAAVIIETAKKEGIPLSSIINMFYNTKQLLDGRNIQPTKSFPQ